MTTLQKESTPKSKSRAYRRTEASKTGRFTANRRENFLLMDQAYQEAVDQMQKDTKSEYSAKGRTLTAFGPYRTNNSAEMESVMKAKDLHLQELIFGEGGRNVSVDRWNNKKKYK